ncbi:MAG: AAA family ATPase [Oscillospiraceae bacterium]|nr:AAA family ATPase [Oscillospiraceae bacterium]
MKLVLLIGNSAVGKMTVGQELAKITGLRLFHNHMMIEPVLEIFGQWRPDVTQRLRQVIFEEFAKTDLYGMIFTYMWAFDMQSDWDYVDWVKGIFSLPEEDVYYVELIAPQEVRLKRNATENRLKNKASKRNVTESNARLLRDDQNWRCESYPGEITHPNYLRLENADLPAAEAARIIKEQFNL